MALSIGDIQPPKNKVTDRMESIQMLAYSAIWNMAQDMPEYSTMWPATISDSPSITSNGVRLVSARPETKKTTRIGNNGNQFQDRKVRPMVAK
ncbi:MAG: hypothetical protein ACD_34C00561G0001 [uncultured bacterium]|nr:MAG: hypothetical protein ACD_34C00561G0001 [uncultured bacterium]